MQRFSCKVFLALFVISVIGTVENVWSAEQETKDILENSKKWDVEFTPYFWAAEIEGDATLRGRTGKAEASFSDLLDNLDIAFMGRLEAWQDKWGLFFDALYMDLGAEYTTPRGLVSTDIDLKMTMFEFGLGYHLWKSRER